MLWTTTTQLVVMQPNSRSLRPQVFAHHKMTKCHVGVCQLKRLLSNSRHALVSHTIHRDDLVFESRINSVITTIPSRYHHIYED
jgi:hypothetical protein